MIEAVRLRRNGSSTVASIPKPMLREAEMVCGTLAVWEILPDKTLRLSPLRDSRLQPHQPYTGAPPAPELGAK